MKQFYYAVYLLIFFSLSDYIGYNRSKKDGMVNTYHGIMFGLLVLYIGCMWWWVSWKCAAIVFLLWWTWLADWMYYGWAMLTDGSGNIGWEGRQVTRAIFKVNAITSSQWTPLGIYERRRWGFTQDKWQWLALQTAIGILISIGLAIY